jgi:hypothetical protein
MKAYICDGCGKREEPQPSYDIPPKGWYTVMVHGPKFEQRHYC